MIVLKRFYYSIHYLHAVVIAVHLRKAEPPAIASATGGVVVADRFQLPPHLTREHGATRHGEGGARLWRDI